MLELRMALYVCSYEEDNVSFNVYEDNDEIKYIQRMHNVWWSEKKHFSIPIPWVLVGSCCYALKNAPPLSP